MFGSPPPHNGGLQRCREPSTLDPVYPLQALTGIVRQGVIVVCMSETTRKKATDLVLPWGSLFRIKVPDSPALHAARSVTARAPGSVVLRSVGRFQTSLSLQAGDPSPKRQRYATRTSLIRSRDAGSRRQRRPIRGVAAGRYSERSGGQLVPAPLPVAENIVSCGPLCDGYVCLQQKIKAAEDARRQSTMMTATNINRVKHRRAPTSKKHLRSQTRDAQVLKSGQRRNGIKPMLTEPIRRHAGRGSPMGDPHQDKRSARRSAGPSGRREEPDRPTRSYHIYTEDRDGRSTAGESDGATIKRPSRTQKPPEGSGIELAGRKSVCRPTPPTEPQMEFAAP